MASIDGGTMLFLEDGGGIDIVHGRVVGVIRCACMKYCLMNSLRRCCASYFGVTGLLESRGHLKKLLWVKCGVMALRLVRPRSARPAPIANTAPYAVAKTHAVW